MSRFCFIVVTVASTLFVGCSQSTDSDSAVTTEFAGLTVSVNNPDAGELPPDGGAMTSTESADRATDVLTLLKTIRQLRAAPVEDDINQAHETRRKRNLHIVKLATDVLRLTIGQAEQAEPFDAGIKQLLEARYQLALNGTDQDITQLYADVQALNDRDPDSDHAADGIYYLAKFAHTKARLQGRSDPMWFENFSRWAREFADRFPQHTERAASLLFGAGRSCEMHSVVVEAEADASRLRTEAKLCYSALTERFGATTEGREATAVLRRMALPGKQLSQFAGPTLDGAYINAEDVVDKVTVIYFWDSENAEFISKLLPLLQQANDVSNGKLRFIGVPLDEDETALRAFVGSNRVPGHQIFFSDAAQRSWNSPLIRFWGISRSPSVWLVERDGVVKVVDVGGPQLVEKMRPLFQ